MSGVLGEKTGTPSTYATDLVLTMSDQVYRYSILLDVDAAETGCRFPGIERFHPNEQLLVVSDEGDVYQGSHAWIMCLYALREYRAWSQRLASPLLLPWARRVCELVSENRLSLSGWLQRLDDARLREELVSAIPTNRP